MKNYLNFETEVKNLEDELENLKDPYNQSGLSEVDTKKISKTQDALNEKLKFILLKQAVFEGSKSFNLKKYFHGIEVTKWNDPELDNELSSNKFWKICDFFNFFKIF